MDDIKKALREAATQRFISAAQSQIDRKDASDLAEAINNFLWRHMPDDTTLGEADKIAGEIYELMTTPRRKREGGKCDNS